MSEIRCCFCKQYREPAKLNKLAHYDFTEKLCDGCFQNHYPERFSLKQNLKLAEKSGLPATLMLIEWLTTVRYFNWNCAYCLERPYDVLEHFIPMKLGGGTVAWNCVPACRSCNALKGRKKPLSDEIDGISRLSLLRVQVYLKAQFQQARELLETCR